MLITRCQVLESTDRKDAIPEIAAKVAANKAAKGRPYEAVLVRMGTLPYEPFDEELFKPLIPGCKIIASASAGYNEFDVDWMTHSGIWFCNTRNAVSEATADMSMFLILATLRDATRNERYAREGKWRVEGKPTRDPRGLTLGIIGMGGIGKVSREPGD
jgi:lactate dehydrogenase-like 2-hydroxyacid dehydrogenase